LFTLNPQVNKYATQVRSHNRWYSTSEDPTKSPTPEGGVPDQIEITSYKDKKRMKRS